jgi:hypothetical protein
MPKSSIRAVGHYTIKQNCVLCDSAVEFPEGTRPATTCYICDECKEAIAFIKEFRAGIREVPADKAKEIEVSIALL